jgi:disulfide bond formation protein DsbB
MGAAAAILASSVGTVSLFLALLAVLADLVVLGALGLMIAAGFSSGAAELRARLRELIGPSSLWLAWAVALVATLGSLYFSEVAHFVPCKLCWYQRICMYPLVVLLAVAAWKGRAELARATLPLVAIGATISTYHYLLERFPSWDTVASCDPAAPCTVVWVWRLHYLSIPGMALSAFLLIAVLILASRDASPDQRTE